MPIRVGMTIAAAEKVLIAATLEQTKGNMAHAATMLGIDRSTLYAKIQRYGIARRALSW